MNGKIFLADEDETLAFGKRLAQACEGRGLITLHGDLGSGKTTLSRGLVQALGHQGAVKSPTYTLVEPYELPSARILHYDLYRLNDPEELEFLGVRDFLDHNTLTLIEWPERAGTWLPSPDLAIFLSVEGTGRSLRWETGTINGEEMGRRLVAGS